MPQTTLFTAQNLTDLLREEISAEQAAMAERVVWGWLKPVLNLDERPQEISDELFSWAVELGAGQVENPAGLAESQLEGERKKYSLERRQYLLGLAASGGTDTGGSTGAGSLAPSGRFSQPLSYPDAAERW